MTFYYDLSLFTAQVALKFVVRLPMFSAHTVAMDLLLPGDKCWYACRAIHIMAFHDM